MKKAILIFACVAAGAIAFVIFGYTALIAYLNWPDRPIAQNVKVTREWTEIHLDHPLTFRYRSQTLNLHIKGFKFDPDSKIDEIKLADGTKLSPEIEILDDNGNPIKMDHSGFTLKYFDAVVFRLSDTINENDRYTVIRIRSDVPFYCEGVYWIDYDPK